MEIKQNVNDRVFLEKLYINFFWASMFAILCGNIGSIVGNIVIGNAISSDRLAVVSLSLPIYYVFATIGNMTGIGGSAVCAELIGKNSYEECKKAYTATYIFTLFSTLFFTLIFLAFLPKLISILGSSANLYTDLRNYVLVMVIGGVFTAGVYLSFNFLRLDGKGSATTLTFVLMGVVNIIFDLLLTMWVKMGVMGVSIATSLGAMVATLFGIIVIRKKSTLLGFTKISFSEFIYYLKKIVIVGSPGASENISILLKVYILNRIIVAMAGDGVLSSLSVINSAGNFASAIIAGGAGALIPLVGVFSAERDTKSIRNLVLISFIFCGGLTLVFSGILIGFSEGVASIFGMKGLEELLITGTALKIFALSLPLQAICNILIYLHLSNKKTAVSNIMNFSRNFLFIVVFAYVFIKNWGSIGLWWAYLFCEVATLIVMLITNAIECKRNSNLSYFFLLDRKYEKAGRVFSESIMDDGESIKDVTARIQAFCEEAELMPKTEMAINLAMEEIVNLVAKYSTREGKDHIISLRILLHEDFFVLRIRYEGAMFNPIDYYNSKKSDSSDLDAMLELADSLGIKMILDICDVVDYKTTFGINNLTVISN